MDKREILRYMGAGPDVDVLDELIERAQREVKAAAAPRWIYRQFSLEVEESAVVIGGTRITSKSLADHLRGCEEAFLFAITIGPEVDRLIRRYTLTEMPFVPVLQAVAAAYTEECADEAQREIEQYAAENGLYLRPRYSPGYGDFSLENQRFLFAALEVSKKTGITLTDSCMMVPSKSVSAVIGLSPDPSLCHVGKCMICDMKNCPFRKEEEQ